MVAMFPINLRNLLSFIPAGLVQALSAVAMARADAQALVDYSRLLALTRLQACDGIVPGEDRAVAHVAGSALPVVTPAAVEAAAFSEPPAGFGTAPDYMAVPVKASLDRMWRAGCHAGFVAG